MAPKRKSAAPTAASTSTATCAHKAEAPAEARATEAVAGHVAVSSPTAPAAVVAAPQTVAVVAAFIAAAAAASEVTTTSQLQQKQRFSAHQGDYITVVVTPKMTFELCRCPEWQTVQDISQEELHRGFLSRFPPAMWMSSEKFSFKPALAPSAAITEDTRQLVYRLVSDDVPDERVMLSILRELEKSYEGIIRRAVTETRSEALQENCAQQEQAEEMRRELEKQTTELRRDNKSLRDQLQSIPKRLFLVEQEKDQLRKEQSQIKERVTKAEREHVKLAKKRQTEQEGAREELAALQRKLQGVLAVTARASVTAETGTPAAVAALQEAAAAAQPAESKGQEMAGPPAAPASTAAVSEANASTQTEPLRMQESAKCMVSSVADVSRRVDVLQQQMGSLRGWLLQGMHLLTAASPMLMAMPPTVGGEPY